MVSFLKLLTGTDPLVKEEQTAPKKLGLFGRKQPERASGRSHFVGAFAQEAKETSEETSFCEGRRSRFEIHVMLVIHSSQGQVC